MGENCAMLLGSIDPDTRDRMMVVFVCLMTSCVSLLFDVSLTQEPVFSSAVFLVKPNPLSKGWLPDLLGLDLTLCLDERFKLALAEFCRLSLTRDDRYVVVIPFDSSVGVTARAQFCGLQKAVPRENLLYLCFDSVSENMAREWGMRALKVLSTRPLTRVERHRMKLLVPCVLVSYGLVCYVVDSDVFFLGNFSDIWDYRWDIELSSNAPDVTKPEHFSFRARDLNSGLVRYEPSVRLFHFLREVLAFASRDNCSKDQISLNCFLRQAVRRKGTWALPRFGIRFHILDPLKAPTGSVLLCTGRNRLKRLAQEKGVANPLVVHLNWHMYVQSKIKTMRLLGWFCNDSCGSFEWPFWTTANFPSELRCGGPNSEIVISYDPEDNSSLLSYWEMYKA